MRCVQYINKDSILVQARGRVLVAVDSFIFVLNLLCFNYLSTNTIHIYDIYRFCPTFSYKKGNSSAIGGKFLNLLKYF